KVAQAGTYQDAAKQADVLNARAQVNQAQANLRLAQGNTTQDILKQQQIQQAREAAQTAQAQVDAAKQQVAYAKAQLDKTIIRSPISGTVLQLASQQGETLAAGLSAPTLIIVADLNRLQVDVFVDETDIGKVKIGQEAEVMVDAFPKTPFVGKVSKVASGSTIQQGVITYDVTISLERVKRPARPANSDANGTQGNGTEGNGNGGRRRSENADANATPNPGFPGGAPGEQGG